MIFYRYYTSIDHLPIYNWVEFNKTGNPELLIVKKGWFHRGINKVVEGLYEQFYTRFGRTKEFTEHLNKIRKLTVMICSNGIKFDTATAIHIKALEAEINKFAEQQDFDFNKNVAAISKFMGYRIDTKKVSVADYYGYIKLMAEAAKTDKKSS